MSSPSVLQGRVPSTKVFLSTLETASGDIKFCISILIWFLDFSYYCKLIRGRLLYHLSPSLDFLAVVEGQHSLSKNIWSNGILCIPFGLKKTTDFDH